MKQLAFILIGIAWSCQVLAAESAPARAATCTACHGADGVSFNPEWPNLAGQKEGYLRDQIRAFRDGVRSNPQMAPMVRGLSDEDIDDLARWFASRPRATTANGDASLVERGQQLAVWCVACHGMKGVTANPEWPNLAGQHARYLESQLEAMADGRRENTIMAPYVESLSDEDRAALAAYFSQLEP